MKPDSSKRLMVLSALMWIAAILLPVIVMVVLDAFDAHSPSNIACCSSLFIFLVFVAHNIWLGGQLKQLRESPTV